MKLRRTKKTVPFLGATLYMDHLSMDLWAFKSGSVFSAHPVVTSQRNELHFQRVLTTASSILQLSPELARPFSVVYREKTDSLNSTAVKYSLHKCNELMLPQSNKFTVQMLPHTRVH